MPRRNDDMPRAVEQRGAAGARGPSPAGPGSAGRVAAPLQRRRGRRRAAPSTAPVAAPRRATAQPGEPPAEHTDAQRQDAAPEHGCLKRQQAEQHQQAPRLDRWQQRQHQQVEFGVVHRVLDQVRQDAQQDGERDPRQQLRADEPQTAGRRPDGLRRTCRSDSREPAQRIGGAASPRRAAERAVTHRSTGVRCSHSRTSPV